MVEKFAFVLNNIIFRSNLDDMSDEDTEELNKYEDNECDFQKNISDPNIVSILHFQESIKSTEQ